MQKIKQDYSILIQGADKSLRESAVGLRRIPQKMPLYNQTAVVNQLPQGPTTLHGLCGYFF